MKEKKIFIDLLNLATPQIAGVGYFTRNLLSRWLVKKLPYKITCYSSSAINAQEVFGFAQSSNIKVKAINIKHVGARLLYQQLVLPFILTKFDLYYNPAVGLPFLARIISPKTKLIVTIHDMTPFFFPRKYSRGRSILVKMLSKYAAKAAHAIFTVSENSKKDLVNISKISPDKITVVYNFIPHSYQLENDNDERYFLCISTIEPGKNLEHSLRGFAEFKKDPSFSEYKFYWIGRIGWVYSEDYVSSLIQEMNVRESFIKLGYLTEHEKSLWIKNCTAIVYLSYYEGFGLPVLEGLSYNKPAVVSNVSSLPEVVGKTGVQCGPEDITAIAKGLKTIIVNRKQFVSEIPQQLAKFDPEKQIAVFHQAIRKLAES